ncbi:potassium channel protein [Phormidium sp. FACHB-592]|uniref:Potassium channel protein n=1 Tax=Stenomitos frigidus AS-A4 TaxID=2933935 RepID=A0ABV0KJG6_9CYAN|nr:potassium channel protein [Phormidium sp. FACHB-592]MBD2074542.1 potassium channel protein [Phormidium sp. FACHB-592]
MHGSLKRILTGAGFLSLTLVIAVAGYRLSGWSLLDSIYMVVITVFGVGFGEMGPMTPQLRIFTMLVIIAGCTSVGYIFGGFFQMITEGEINQALGARRMTKEINTLTRHVIICGYGRIGQILARQMVEAKQPFVIIDNNLTRIETAEAMGFLVRLGNATDEGILESAGIERAKVLATVLPDDAANVFITLTARGLNPNLIILSRGEYPSTEKKLRQAGADHVVLPAEIGALRMSHIIRHPAALSFLEETVDGSSLNELLSQIDVQVDELAVVSGSPLIGSSISTVQVRGKGTFIVVALRRVDGTTLINPSHNVHLAEGDTVIVMGHKGDIPKFAHHYALKRQMRWRGDVVQGQS